MSLSRATLPALKSTLVLSTSQCLAKAPLAFQPYTAASHSYLKRPRGQGYGNNLSRMRRAGSEVYRVVMFLECGPLKPLRPPT